MGAILVLILIFLGGLQGRYCQYISLLTFVVVVVLAPAVTVLVVADKVGSRWEEEEEEEEDARRRRHSNWNWATCRKIYQFTGVISAVH